MHCSRVVELLSADFDGETTEIERAAIAAHLDECASCRNAQIELARLSWRLRVRRAEEPPDLTDAILSAAEVRTVASRSTMVLRYALAAVAATQFLVSLPELFASMVTDEPIHVEHHLGGWDLSLALALLVVVVQPWRARGLLPMGVALSVAMLGMSAVDLVHGQVPLVTEASHTLELASVVLLWMLARVAPSGPEGQPRGRRTRDDAPGVRTLSLVTEIEGDPERGIASASAHVA